MFNKIKTYLNDRNYIIVKCGDKIVLKIPKKSCRPYNGGKRKIYLSDIYHTENKGIEIFDIPYIDEEIPELIVVDEKTNQLLEIFYIVDGLGYLGRVNDESPSRINIKNGKITREQYAVYIRRLGEKKHYPIKTRKPKTGVTQFTIPDTVVYKEDRSINQLESIWRFEIDIRIEGQEDISHLDTKLITFEKYREILSNISIDPSDYKKWTHNERMMISIYMDVEAYKDIFDILEIECSMESFEKNKELFEMYYT